MTTDRRVILLAAFLRAVATGMVGVLIGIYLARRGFDAAEIGSVVGAGLAGAALAALFVTLFSDRVGRRRILVMVSLAGVAGGVGVLTATTFGVLVGAAFFGMINGMGRDRGAALIIDQALLPASVPEGERTKAFAWYNVLQDLGHAVGGLAAGAPVLLSRFLGLSEQVAAEVAIGAYCGILLATAVLYGRLSSESEAPSSEGRSRAARPVLSSETKRVLWKISSLFAFDSLAGGFLTAALVSLFFFERFNVSEGMVGLLFFGSRVANAGSHFGAAWLAKRIGLVNTMVFTHIPSSLLLGTVAFAPTFPIAAALFLLREGLVEMDVPTRQSYVIALVKKEERLFASGVTHLVRLGAWAIAPAFAGLLMRGQGASMATPLFVGAGMKIAYDVLLYRSFKNVVPRGGAT